MFGFVCYDNFSIASQKKSVSKDFFGRSFLDIYFCPFFKSQNTFHFSKTVFLYNKLKNILKENRLLKRRYLLLKKTLLIIHLK